MALTLVAMVGLIAAPAVSAAPPARDGLTTTLDDVTGTINGVPATFTDGELTITEFAVVNGGLTVSGTLEGLLNGVPVSETFENVAVGQGTGAACDILTLDIGAIFLDLLGLQVDIAPISIDVTAVPGAGNLLGNLLCAVAGLLDGPDPLGGLIDRLLAIINNLLG